MKYNTEQEAFWAGEFGSEYIHRNTSEEWVSSNIALFSKIFSRTHDVSSVLEFGANIGLNLRAIKALLPKSTLSAIEINADAALELNKLGIEEVFHQSMLDFEPSKQYDLTLAKNVLIHINPDALPRVYEKLYKSSRRYICVCEYYNPSPVVVPYRGHTDRLFKRDFAGEMLDKYTDLKLLDYGFVYRRDPNFRQDDTTWFLLEKTR
jgi:pseudaminic acid biosynthesis-associated methylase